MQIGLPYGGWGKFNGQHLATAEDYLRAAYHFAAMGEDCLYCAASHEIQKMLCDNHIRIVAAVGLIPSYITRTGFCAIGKTAGEAPKIYAVVRRQEELVYFGAELEVVLDRMGDYIPKNATMIMLGMGAGPGADAEFGRFVPVVGR